MENTDSLEPEVMLSLRDVRVSYGEREILHGVSFDVKRGETLVILGGSGSGKSTLLRTLVGLEKSGSRARTLRPSPMRRWTKFAKRLECRFRAGRSSVR
jgi:phospholipid/cholesterol/gamma-HCH transport system ATP-binding protein